MHHPCLQKHSSQDSSGPCLNRGVGPDGLKRALQPFCGSETLGLPQLLLMPSSSSSLWQDGGLLVGGALNYPNLGVRQSREQGRFLNLIPPARARVPEQRKQWLVSQRSPLPLLCSPCNSSILSTGYAPTRGSLGQSLPFPSTLQVTSAPKATRVPHAVRARSCSSLISKLARGPAGYEKTYRKNKLPKTHT